MSNRRLFLLSILLLILLLASVAVAAPPDWAKGKKSKTPLQTITEQTEPASQPSAPTQPAPTTTTRSVSRPATPAPTMQQGAANVTPPATPEERRINWEAISVGLVIIGAIIGWLISRRIRNKSAYYLKEIDVTHHRYKDEPEALDSALSELRELIVKDFERGRLTDNALAMLEGRIDKYSKGARVETAAGFRLPKDIGQQIKAMLDDGVISEEEYGRFTEMDLSHLSQKEYERLTKLMQKWKGSR